MTIIPMTSRFEVAIGSGRYHLSRYHRVNLLVQSSYPRSQIILNPFTRPGKHTKNYGKSPCLIGKLTISMAMFNSFLYVYQRLNPKNLPVRFPLSSAASQAVAAEEVIATGQLETVLRPVSTGHLRLGWQGWGEYRGKTTDANGHATGTD